jgi:hypothetical protein
MPYTRRQTLDLGLTTLAALGLSTLLPRAVFAQSAGDSYPTDSGEIVIHPVSHASLVMNVPGMVIYVDPVGGAAAYESFDPPDLVLITHEHGDHYEAETLSAIAGDGTRLITNPAVFEMLPEDLKAKAEALANGESTTVGDLTIDAIPAYNMSEDRLQYHPEGRDNGYVLGIDGRRVYIAGDTEDIPEMRALEDIDIAFVPMNLPTPWTKRRRRRASAPSPRPMSTPTTTAAAISTASSRCSQKRGWRRRWCGARGTSKQAARTGFGKNAEKSRLPVTGP